MTRQRSNRRKINFLFHLSKRNNSLNPLLSRHVDIISAIGCHAEYEINISRNKTEPRDRRETRDHSECITGSNQESIKRRVPREDVRCR